MNPEENIVPQEGGENTAPMNPEQEQVTSGDQPAAPAEGEVAA